MKKYDPFLSEGLAAYAERQAHLRMSLKDLFQDLWKDVDAWVTGRKVVPDDGHASDAENDDDN